MQLRRITMSKSTLVKLGVFSFIAIVLAVCIVSSSQNLREVFAAFVSCPPHHIGSTRNWILGTFYLFICLFASGQKVYKNMLNKLCSTEDNKITHMCNVYIAYFAYM